MKSLLVIVVFVDLSLSVSAEEIPQKAANVQQKDALKSTPDVLPHGMHDFNGMLLGRLTAKDVEKGTFVVHVDAVPRVWRNSKAEDPQSVVGKTVNVNGVFGKFLDVLVVARKGETLEFECKHMEMGSRFPVKCCAKWHPMIPMTSQRCLRNFVVFKAL